jgi:hypothetical protein
MGNRTERRYVGQAARQHASTNNLKRTDDPKIKQKRLFESPNLVLHIGFNRARCAVLVSEVENKITLNYDDGE